MYFNDDQKIDVYMYPCPAQIPSDCDSPSSYPNPQ